MYTILEWEEADLLDAGIVYKPLPALPGGGTKFNLDFIFHNKHLSLPREGREGFIQVKSLCALSKQKKRLSQEALCKLFAQVHRLFLIQMPEIRILQVRDEADGLAG